MMPHLAEECWAALGHKTLVSMSPGRTVEAGLLVENTVTLPVQVNGKKRADVTVPRDAEKPDIEAAVLALDAVQKALDGKAPQKGHCCPAKDRECRRLSGNAWTCNAWRRLLAPPGCGRWRWRPCSAAASSRSMATRSLTGGPRPAPALAAVEVVRIDVPERHAEARVAVEVRNDLIFGLNGGAGGADRRPIS